MDGRGTGGIRALVPTVGFRQPQGLRQSKARGGLQMEARVPGGPVSSVVGGCSPKSCLSPWPCVSAASPPGPRGPRDSQEDLC